MDLPSPSRGHMQTKTFCNRHRTTEYLINNGMQKMMKCGISCPRTTTRRPRGGIRTLSHGYNNIIIVALVEELECTVLRSSIMSCAVAECPSKNNRPTSRPTGQDRQLRQTGASAAWTILCGGGYSGLENI